MRARQATAIVLALLAFSGVAGAADGNETGKARCQSSYVTSQALRRDGKLSEAKTQLLICKETCSASFAGDCARWLDEVDALFPRVRLVVVSSEGRPVSDARLFVDGSHLELDESSLPLEPGTHVLRVEARGYQPSETTVSLRVGERERPVEVVLEPNAPPPRERADNEEDDLEKVRMAAARDQGGSRVPSFVVGGVGIASLVAAGALAIKGHVDRSGFSECSPRCDPKEVDAVRSTWVVAGVLGAVGAVTIGLAVVLWPSSSHSVTTHLRVAPRSVALSWDLP